MPGMEGTDAGDVELSTSRNDVSREASKEALLRSNQNVIIATSQRTVDLIDITLYYNG
jgi:NACalpha-BTF3-like transcription factor